MHNQLLKFTSARCDDGYRLRWIEKALDKSEDRPFDDY